MISIIIPIHNEKENIGLLLPKLRAVLAGRSHEIIFIDDGSTDGSGDILGDLASTGDQVKAIFLQKNFGQTAAIAAGIDHAIGEVIIPMDGDLENDPADIPKLLAKLEEGYDIVSGWRMKRWQNEFFTRKLPSSLANWLISRIAGVRLHDFGCTLKAYRAEIIKSIKLYGEMHRFITAYAYWNGAKITEIPVNYIPRVHGQTHYGFNRVWRVIFDLLTLKFLSGYATRPLHLFGSVGLISILLGLTAGGFAVYFKFSETNHKDFIQTPLPVLMATLVIVGIMFVMIGLLAEILVRTYHESQGKTIYQIKDKINL